MNGDGNAGKPGFVTYNFSRASTFWFKVLDSRQTGTDAWGAGGEGAGGLTLAQGKPLPWSRLPGPSSCSGSGHGRYTQSPQGWKSPCNEKLEATLTGAALRSPFAFPRSGLPKRPKRRGALTQLQPGAGTDAGS